MIAAFSPGTVVQCLPDSRSYRPGASDQRGVVVWAQGHDNHLHYDGIMAPVPGEVVIRFSAGHQLFTTFTHAWAVVTGPLTAQERVWSAIASYRTPDWYEDNDRVPDNETFAWRVMVATLPLAHYDRIFGVGDHPIGFQDLAEAMAECQDFDALAVAATFS